MEEGSEPGKYHKTVQNSLNITELASHIIFDRAIREHLYVYFEDILSPVSIIKMCIYISFVVVMFYYTFFVSFHLAN